MPPRPPPPAPPSPRRGPSSTHVFAAYALPARVPGMRKLRNTLNGTEAPNVTEESNRIVQSARIPSAFQTAFTNWGTILSK